MDDRNATTQTAVSENPFPVTRSGPWIDERLQSEVGTLSLPHNQDERESSRNSLIGAHSRGDQEEETHHE